MMKFFAENRCALIGVVHVDPLPGADDWQGDMQALIDKAIRDARAYAGVDAIIVENMHDVPYLMGGVEPETVAAMAVVARAVKEAIAVPLGIQILAGANLHSLGAAVASGADFIRAEGFVFAHIGDEGLHVASAPTLLRRRAQLGARHIAILTDIKKKHSSHAITGDITLEETAHAAEFFKSDGVIVTGSRTGDAPGIAEVAHTKGACSIPVIVGSGVDEKNFSSFATAADALIVGSYFKHEGDWRNPVDQKRVAYLTGELARVNAERARS